MCKVFRKYISSRSGLSYDYNDACAANKFISFSSIQTILCLVVLLTFPGYSFAHEAWVLSPEQFDEWNAKPRPAMFTSLNTLNVSLTLLSALFVVAIIILEKNYSSIKDSISSSQYLNNSEYASLAVRWSMAIMLGMAAFGLSPRHGTEVFEASTLVAPDLEIRLLGSNWQWLAWMQAVATISLLLGVYVRLTAFIILCLDIVGIYVFGYKMIAYAGIVGGVAVYMLIAGPGKYSLSVPFPDKFKRVQNYLESQSVFRAQYLMRLLAGVNLIYLGVEYKFFQPNLSLAFIEMQNIFTFWLRPETFVFCMFLVETVAGVLMVLGMMMRVLSVILFCAFMFLAYALGENPLGHIIFYGILISCFINGAGRWALNNEAAKFDGYSDRLEKSDQPMITNGKKIIGLFDR